MTDDVDEGVIQPVEPFTADLVFRIDGVLIAKRVAVGDFDNDRAPLADRRSMVKEAERQVLSQVRAAIREAKIVKEFAKGETEGSD